MISQEEDLLKSRHSRAGGNPESSRIWKRLDSRFHGNDGKAYIQIFYEYIKLKSAFYTERHKL
jgi:hypothetical protein